VLPGPHPKSHGLSAFARDLKKTVEPAVSDGQKRSTAARSPLLIPIAYGFPNGQPSPSPNRRHHLKDRCDQRHN
jgi:hypothetical protein